MENGQKYNIPLDSPLDVHSSDMLASVQEPVLQHNRQKYQGKYLPSSVRFEQDGWAAGTDVYTFEVTEAMINAGSFIISKQNINKNPTYKIVAKDANKKTIGGMYYNPENEIKQYTMTRAEITDGVNPTISGEINGKEFSIPYNSVEGTFGEVTGKNITVETDLKGDYTFEITMTDNDATIDITFNGLELPANTIINEYGNYTMGTFEAYMNDNDNDNDSNGKTIWSTGNGNIAISDSGELFIDNKEYVSVLSVDGDTGHVTGTVYITMKLYDNTQIQTEEFYPYISNITTSTTSNVVNNSAVDILQFNRWSSSINGKGGRYTKTKLVNIGDEEDAQVYSQKIEHELPVWIGVSYKLFNGYVSGFDNFGKVYNTGDEYICNKPNFKKDSYFTREFPLPVHTGETKRYIKLYISDTVYEYDRAVVDTTLKIWVAGTAYDYTDDAVKVNGLDYSDGLKNFATYLLHVENSYPGNDNNHTYGLLPATFYVKDFDTDSSKNSVDITSQVKGTNGLTVKKATLYKLDYSTLPTDGTPSLRNITFKALHDVGGIITHSYYCFPNISLGGIMNHHFSVTEIGIYTFWFQTLADRIYLDGLKYAEFDTRYDGYSYYDGNAGTYTFGAQNSETRMSYWCACLKGKLTSTLSINKGIIRQSSGLDMFTITKEKVSGSNYVDLSRQFSHTIGGVAIGDNMSMQIYVCSNDEVAKMAYSSVEPPGNDTKDAAGVYYVPGYIAWGDKNKGGDGSFGNMSSYDISTYYSSTTVDTNYGIILTINGTPVLASNNTKFNYITGITSAPTVITNFVGTATNDYISGYIVDNIKYTVLNNTPIYKFNGAADSSKDWEYITDRSNNIVVTIDWDNLKNLKFTLDYNLDNGPYKIIKGNNFDKGTITHNFTYNNTEHTLTVSVQSINSIKGDIKDEKTGAYIEPLTLSDCCLYFEITDKYMFDTHIHNMLDNYYTLNSINNNIVTVSRRNDKKLTLDLSTNNATIQMWENNSWGPIQDTDEVWGPKYAVTLTSQYTRTLNAALMGVYNTSNIQVTGLSPTIITAIINGETVDINVAQLINSKQQSKMNFMYTRVNDRLLTAKQFAEIVSDNEFQILKQQWDTTNETENFWWLNDKYILVLTKSELIIRQKTDEITDWDGDKFVDVMHLERIQYIDTSVLQYFCSSAYDGETAKFITIAEENNNIVIDIYSFIDGDTLLSKPSVATVTFKINKVSIGKVLNEQKKTINTYSDLVTENVVSQSKWSATCIDGKVILGCHYDNNFNQWCIIINGKSVEKIIQGYGFVGVDGSLTGGEIPSKYFDTEVGFNNTVQSLSVLSGESKSIVSVAEITTVDDRIVGNDSQQWYISKDIPAIVSHLTYANGQHYINEIQLNNNYSAKYNSASFSSTVFSDYSFKIKAMRDLLPAGGPAWDAAMVLWLSPMLYYIAPKISMINYLQQSLGQAAYVHYNSTSIRQHKDLTTESVTSNTMEGDKQQILAVMSDEISFDVQTVKQTQSTSDPYSTVFTMFAASLVSALDWGQEKLQVNKNQNQSATLDFGRKYANNFIQNVNSMAIADMNLQAVNPTQTSEVTAVKSLDMFYSTSDKQQVYAGRGYVNHNFVAQCVAQSVTSVQSEVSQQKLMYIMSALTLLPLQTTLKALLSARNAIQAQLDSLGGPGGAGVFVTYTTPATIILGLIWAGFDVACNVTKIGIEILPQMISALGGDKLTSSITARQSKHAYDIEGKHKYGSKTECFMWPCFGIDTAQYIVDESVEVTMQNKSWRINMPAGNPKAQVGFNQPEYVTDKPTDSVKSNFDGSINYYIAMIKGNQKKIALPSNMAYVIGAESFLSTSDFKNENISMSEPVFATPPFQDYLIDKQWQVSQTASVGMTTWVSVKDTKIIDGEYSNAVISNEFCGIAAPYTAIEIKRGIQQQYMRPWAITPQALALNQTGLNCCYEEKAYHAFDGYGYRIVNWTGSPGMNKEHQTWLYSFLVNDRFKRSNKLPQNEFLGNFKSDPVMATSGDYNDKIFTLVTQPGEGKGLQAGTVGEDKDVRRYALPVFSEFVNTLPAAVKTTAVQVLSVVDGVTSLTTENRDLQTAYKSPLSVDFTIGKNKYRFTQEYICVLQQQSGVTVVEDVVPCLGLDFIGSTPYEAYLYSHSTKQYYTFTGGTSLQLIDMIERFRDVVNGRYDFVNQEVLLPCVATFLRLDKNVLDDEDETDNVMIPRLKDRDFVGEVWPPLDTIYNTRSWFRTLSLPCGVTYQGPNRCIINRFILNDYMIDQIKDNYGKWQRVPREEYHPFRKYKAKYDIVDTPIGDDVDVKGWTHNPFLLVTAPLGVSNEVDCKFEWEITFCWPVEMDKLYAANNYAVVNIQAETMTPGGKVVAARPTHVYLTKELFTRTCSYGYYSFRYQSNCGAGNRERLHIWSDQYICVSGLQVEVAQITERRTEQLTQQVDVQLLAEI